MGKPTIEDIEAILEEDGAQRYEIRPNGEFVLRDESELGPPELPKLKRPSGPTHY